MSRPLWHVIEDPAFVITIYAGLVILLMLIGAVIIYLLTQSIYDAALASIPPILIALIMVAARRAIKGYEVAIYPDKLVVIRGYERREVPIHALTKIRVRPVIITVRLRGVRFIPIHNVPRLNTWSITFMSGNEELAKVWVNESELNMLRAIIRRMCMERSLCINIEGVFPG